jgi:hypothetical protein
MHTEKIIQDLLNQLRDGRLTRKNFEQALFSVIDKHTRTIVETSLYDERTTFIRELYSKLVVSESYANAYVEAVNAWEFFANKRNEEYQAAMAEQQAKQQQTSEQPVPAMKVIKDETISEGV